MEFLVHIQISLPEEMGDERRDELTVAEAERAAALLAEGTIRRIWRIPGRTANVGIWEAEDASHLHAKLGSLPLSRWMDIEVEALALHPAEAGDG
jgi:muconolactone D-isomerase